MIKPTIGRVVWYHPLQTDPGGIVPGNIQAAIIAYVHSNTNVNLMVIDPDGTPYSRTSVYLLQEGNESPGVGYAEWMPYQKGQAAKTEEMERRLGGVDESPR